MKHVQIGQDSDGLLLMIMKFYQIWQKQLGLASPGLQSIPPLVFCWHRPRQRRAADRPREVHVRVRRDERLDDLDVPVRSGVAKRVPPVREHLGPGAMILYAFCRSIMQIVQKVQIEQID